MNYLGNNVEIKAQNDITFFNYYANIDTKSNLFPEQLQPVIYNQLKELSIFPFGSLNFKFNYDDNINLQVPYSVELENCSIGEFLLFNLSLKSNIDVQITQYNKDTRKSSDINLIQLQTYLNDFKLFYLENICWDISQEQKIELFLNISIENKLIECKLSFYETDILLAQLRTPNYTNKEYNMLKKSGEHDIVGYNRIAKILNVFEQHFQNKNYQLM